AQTGGQLGQLLGGQVHLSVVEGRRLLPARWLLRLGLQPPHQRRELVPADEPRQLLLGLGHLRRLGHVRPADVVRGGLPWSVPPPASSTRPHLASWRRWKETLAGLWSRCRPASVAVSGPSKRSSPSSRM